MKFLYTELKLNDDNEFIIIANKSEEPYMTISYGKLEREMKVWTDNHQTFKIFDSENEALILKNALKELENELASENNRDLKNGVELDCISIRKIKDKDNLNGEYFAFFKDEKKELRHDILKIIFEKLGGNKKNIEVTEDIIELLIENGYLKK